MLQKGAMTMTKLPSVLHRIAQLMRTSLTLLVDVVHYFGLCLRSPAIFAAKNLFLRKQLALYQERQQSSP
jgi:hypothetical protein